MRSSNDLSLRQLQYVVAIADTLGFRKAAERCHVSQPSLSAQIAQLEDALNVIDWVRTDGRQRLGDGPIVLIGESAGCTLAVLSLLALREQRYAEL